MTKDKETYLKELQEGKKVLQIRSDRTFKILFSEKYQESVIWLLSEMTGIEKDRIKGFIIWRNKELTPFNLYDKRKCVDFIVDVDDEKIVVELNCNDSGVNYLRNIYYTFHALINDVGIGEKYKKKHAYLINLNWFNEKNGKEYKPIEEIHYPYPMLGNKNEDLITIKNINLSYFNKICYNESKEKDFVWKIFTIDNMKDLKKISEKVPELKSYCNELIRLSKDEEYCKMVWNEQIEENLRKAVEREMFEKAEENGIAKGMAKGKAEGEKSGSIKTKKEMVINFFKNSVSLDIIAKSSNLSISEVKKIVGLS